MASTAYDGVADWYEEVFLRGHAPNRESRSGDPIGIDGAMRDLLGQGSGPAWRSAAAPASTPRESASWVGFRSVSIRDKVGATHRPLPELLHAFLAAGLTLEQFSEGGRPAPAMLAIKARKHSHPGATSS